MVVANTSGTHKALPNKETILYDTLSGGNRPEDRIHGWEKTQEIRTGKDDPLGSLFRVAGPESGSDRNDTRKRQCRERGSRSDRRRWRANWKSTIIRASMRNDSMASIQGVAIGMRTFRRFFKTIHARRNYAWSKRRLKRCRFEHQAIAEKPVPASSSSSSSISMRMESTFSPVSNIAAAWQAFTPRTWVTDIGYENAFTVIPSGLPYRPELKTRRAAVAGTQTATVVGPSGEDIFTDKYSRVKVQFHWDRAGMKDENSSCWVRVSTLWAGKQWGMIHIPRIGQEVIVDFEEGDPDRPLILGSVYNAEQMPPYKLPDNRTQSGMKSRSRWRGPRRISTNSASRTRRTRSKSTSMPRRTSIGSLRITTP